jgi:V/A-type H+-transporting ATPase subunit E
MASELIRLLEREAEAERERILAEARERAEGIRNEAETEAAALLEAQRRRIASEVEAARVRAQGTATLRATSLVLEAKDEQIDRVFELARAELEWISHDPARYPAILRRLLQEAVDGFEGRVVVECAESDVAAVEAMVRELGIEADVRPSPDVWGGVRVRSEDGRFVVENTLTSRLERAKHVLLSEVAEILWG